MTAPHPVPPLVALAALAALFFALLAMWLPSSISELDVSSAGGASTPAMHESGDRSANAGTGENVFRQPVVSPLSLFAGR